MGDEVQWGDQYCVRKQASRNFWVGGKKKKQFGSHGPFHGVTSAFKPLPGASKPMHV